MTTVMPSYHGGDGDAPPPPDPWRAPSGHQIIGGNVVHGKTTNKALRNTFNANNQRPLPIRFDTNDQRTFIPVGENGKLLISLIGVTVGNEIPKYYPEWRSVPNNLRELIWPDLQTYFDLNGHLNGLFGTQKRESLTIAGDRYKDRKYRFKKEYVDKYSNEEDLLEHPPPGMDSNEWRRHLDYFTGGKFGRRSVPGTANRVKQLYVSHHGRQSYAAIREEGTGQYGSLFDSYRQVQTNKKGEFTHPIPEQNYNEMLRRWQETRQQEKPPTEDQIMDLVLGVRSGHKKGRGKEVHSSQFINPQVNTGSDQRGSQPYHYTQEDYEVLSGKYNKLEKSHNKLSKSYKKHKSGMKQMWEAFTNKGKGKSKNVEEDRFGSSGGSSAEESSSE